MKTLTFEQHLPLKLNEAWDFFSSPSNLNLLTPPDMHFQILNTLPSKMYEGMFIEYRIKIFGLIPLKWVTEITCIQENNYFIDEQRKGPYKIWHHEHHFITKDDGIVMKDILHYDAGKWVLGWIAGKVFIDGKVKSIFQYRKQVLDSLFNKNN